MVRRIKGHRSKPSSVLNRLKNLSHVTWRHEKDLKNKVKAINLGLVDQLKYARDLSLKLEPILGLYCAHIHTSVRALTPVRTPAIALTRDHTSVRALTPAHTPAIALTRARTRARILAFGRTLSRRARAHAALHSIINLPLDSQQALVRALDCAMDFDHSFTCSSRSFYHRAGTLACSLERVRALANALTRARARVLALGLDRHRHWIQHWRLLTNAVQSLELTVIKIEELEKTMEKMQNYEVNKSYLGRFNFTLFPAALLVLLQSLRTILISQSRQNGLQENLMNLFAASPENKEEMIAHYREFKYELLRMNPNRLYIGLRLWRETFQLCMAMVILQAQNFLAPDSAGTE
jgi:hypothetical protein